VVVGGVLFLFLLGIMVAMMVLHCGMRTAALTSTTPASAPQYEMTQVGGA